eukprot:GHVN01068624.1.p1 GENE.GHVN01068624.1~~GHVN01068624.1.p1  ORF type:complete len:931 (-),score=145.09 GHVN01068624.1:1019-3811(-)
MGLVTELPSLKFISTQARSLYSLISLIVEQSQLTGEAVPKEKETTAMSKDDADCEIQAKTNILFSSTTISSGHAIGIVTATGMLTELGLIQLSVKSASNEEEQTPLAQKIDEFGEWLSKAIGVICVVVWVINYKNFSDPAHGSFIRGCIYYFKIAVALAVAAIPEGLPAVITTCLALGTRRMAVKNAIVRKLSSVETLGCTTVICSDKTGTLTTNEMTCVRVCLPRSVEKMDVFKVEGVSYAPIGEIIPAAGSRGGSPRKSIVNLLEPEGQGHCRLESLTSMREPCREYIFEGDSGRDFFVKCACMCNESKIEYREGKFMRHGEPTEAAIRVLVEKIGCPDQAMNEENLQRPVRSRPQIFSEYWAQGTQVRAVLEFNRDRKSMSVLMQESKDKNPSGDNVLYVKGAPESILDRCTSIMLPTGEVTPLTPSARSVIEEHVSEMGSEALRTLAFACRLECGVMSDYNGPQHVGHGRLSDPSNFIDIESDMIFLGLVGIVDPPRPEVRSAIEECNEAGIKVIMITGDNKLTAEAIAKQIGILSPLDAHGTECSHTGREFEAMTNEDKRRILEGEGGVVFSRTEPKHKQMIIKILKDMGEITAMTGDGVNDAPALKQADIGISMGITGTEVAKEASDMVLADDNFSSIVFAVEEGRSIYNNMKAFIRYLISSNIGEVASIFLTAALGVPEGLAPVQLLWVNLVTDGPPATALGFNPPDLDVMKKPPRHKNESLISGWVFFRYLVIGLYVGFATVGIFVWWYTVGVDPADKHTLVSLYQLRHWSQCQSWDNFNALTVYGMDAEDPCSYFQGGKVKASTLSLTVLVVIEMLNALNALSADGSLLQIPPWANPWLILAIIGSLTTHLLILYIPFLNSVFNVTALTFRDWLMVLVWSFPVVLIDEVMKYIARSVSQSSEAGQSIVRGRSRVVLAKKFQ